MLAFNIDRFISNINLPINIFINFMSPFDLHKIYIFVFVKTSKIQFRIVSDVITTAQTETEITY